MGVELYERGDRRGADAYFRKSEGSLPAIDDHLLYYRGATAQALGRYDEARGFLSRLFRDHPQSIHWADALRRLSEVELALERYDEALHSLDAYDKALRRHAEAKEWSLLMRSHIELARGRTDPGAKFLKKIWIDAPGGFYDEEAEALIKKYHLSISNDDRLRRARGLLRIAQPAAALSLYESLLDRDPDRLEAEEGRLQAWIRLGELDRALARVVELRGRHLPGDWEKTFKAVHIRILMRQDRLAEAKELLEDGHRDVTRESLEAKRRLAFLKMDAGEYAQGAKAYETLARLGGRRQKSGAIWMAGWGYYRAGHIQRAQELFEKGLKYARGPGEQGRLLYWRGRFLEQLGRRVTARDLYCQTIRETGWSYYSWKAAERLRTVPDGEDHCPEADLALPPLDPRRTTTTVPADLPSLDGYHGRRLTLLMRWGLKSLAAREVAATFPEVWGRPEGLTQLARLSQDLGVYSVPLSLAGHREKIGLYGQMPRSSDSEIWRLAFPQAYADDVGRCRNALKVDPLLMWSLMRQESHFRPEIVSASKAVGLMQLIPPTAQRMALQAKLARFRVRDLTEPDTNIRLACRYVDELDRRFNGERAYIAAAYNAGEAAVERWLKRRRDLPVEEFIEEIPYAETNDYVKKVLVNYWTYQRLGV